MWFALMAHLRYPPMQSAAICVRKQDSNYIPKLTIGVRRWLSLYVAQCPQELAPVLPP